MYILFTSEDLIDHCINANFANNSISHLKYLNDIHLKEHEIIIQIKNNTISIIKEHPYQDKLRVDFVLGLVQHCLSQLSNIECIIIINTGDGCSDIDKYTRLCFSCSYRSKHIQIPDPHIFKYQNFKDDISFENKLDKIIFVGSDTGILEDDLLNERIRFAHRSIELDNVYAKISNFVHFNTNMLKDVNINIQDIQSNFISILEQLKYKYILNISGNTASWDRIPWVMKSNSYLLSLDSICDQYNWYYPYITKHRAIDILSFDDIKNKNYEYKLEIKDKQQNIGDLILNYDTHIEYLKYVILRYNQEYNS